LFSLGKLAEHDGARSAVALPPGVGRAVANAVLDEFEELRRPTLRARASHGG